MKYFWVILAAFVGALISATIAWLDSKEAFNGRKFTAGALRGLVAAVLFAIGYTFKETFGVIDVLLALSGGFTFDTGVSAITSIAGKGGSFPIST